MKRDTLEVIENIVIKKEDIEGKMDGLISVSLVEEKIDEWRLYVKETCPTLASLLEYKKLDYKDLDLCSVIMALKSMGYKIRYQ
jgi:hypothetical protein